MRSRRLALVAAVAVLGLAACGDAKPSTTEAAQALASIELGADLTGSNPNPKAGYPIVTFTWILLYKKPQDTAATGEALKFFSWSYAKGGKMAEDLDYVPMPESVVADVMKMWSAEIKDASGKPLYSVTQ